MEIKKHEELYRLISRQLPQSIRGDCLIKLTYLRGSKKYSYVRSRLMLIRNETDIEMIKYYAMDIAIELARLVCEELMDKVRNYRLEV